MRIGVLALQGAFAEHISKMKQINVETFEIRQLKDLSGHFDGLILPGGESTAMRKLLGDLSLYEPLKEIIQNGLPVFGTCAGMILLAKEIEGEEPCFGTLDITVKRNAYGRQLGSFRCVDEFAGKEIISERDLQTYLGRYQDLRDEWKKKKDGDKEDITKDIVFEVELIKQIEINIDYILMLVKKYKDGNCEDKEIVVDIRRAVDASSELRSKKELIETFIANVNEMDDVFDDWRAFVKEQKEKEIDVIITEENLKADETKKFVDNAFRDGELKTTGVGIDSLLPPMRRFGGNSNRAEKKQTVIEKLKAFFEKYFGVV